MSDPLVDQSTATGFQYSGEGTDVAELLALADSALQPLITGYSETGVILTFVAQGAGSNTIPLDGRQYYLVVTGDCTIAVGTKPTAPACGNAVLHILIDTATPPTIALPASMIWADSTLVPIATANGARTRLLLSTDPAGNVHADVDRRGVPA